MWLTSKFFLTSIVFFSLKFEILAQVSALGINPELTTNQRDHRIKEVCSLLTSYFANNESHDRYKLWNSNDLVRLAVPDIYLSYFCASEKYSSTCSFKPYLLQINRVDATTYSAIISFSKASPSFISIAGIVEIIVVDLKGTFKISNTLLFSLKKNKWRQVTIGNVIFNLSPRVLFDEKQASSLIEFDTKISKIFGLRPITISYISTADFAEMQKIRGMHFDLDAVQGGAAQTDFDNNIIYVSNGRLDYFHEVVHIYYFQNYKKTNCYNQFWSEALATYWGGSMEQTLDWHIKQIRRAREFNDSYNFHDLENLKSIDSLPMTNMSYVIGALLCKGIFKKLGDQNGLHKILLVNDMDQTYKLIENVLGVKKNKLGEYLRDQISQL